MSVGGWIGAVGGVLEGRGHARLSLACNEQDCDVLLLQRHEEGGNGSVLQIDIEHRALAYVHTPSAKSLSCGECGEARAGVRRTTLRSGQG